MSGKRVDDKEKFLRLSTYLIDQGEDPISFEFSPNTATTTLPDKKLQAERLKLLQKIVKFEKSYFTKEKSRGL